MSSDIFEYKGLFEDEKYQNEAEELGLSKSIYGAAYSQQIYKSVFGSIEIVRDRDYDGLDETIFSISITLDFEYFY